MIKIGITGQGGFVGTHLYNTVGLFPEEFKRIDFIKEFFQNEELLDEFVKNCDVIVHLAAVNRNPDPQFIYQENLKLNQLLRAALERTKSTPQVLFSSSSQEEKDNLYGKSKKEGRELLEDWAIKNNGKFCGLIIPNVFGPFGLPDYNSFVATFCYKLTHNETPVIENDGEVNLIYVGELVDEILSKIRASESCELYKIQSTTTIKVSEVLSKLRDFKRLYFENGELPRLISRFDLQLFNTFRSYFDIKNHYPIHLVENTDDRGAFVEVIRLGIGGQCSYSTTVPGVTRGNHYHTRKIERFTVIKGKALIQLRKIGTEEILNFELDGENPAYVDMPIWYTHNIKNTGDEELLTIFWINEPFDASDSDTYFEIV